MMAEIQNVDRHISRIVSDLGQAVGQTGIVRSSLFIVMMTLFIAPASGQGTPEAPTLCIDDSGGCGSVVIGAPGSKKWNPGHYLKTQGQPAQSNQTGYITSVLSSIDANMDDNAIIIGAHVGLAWGSLNPVGSTYDWTQLDQVIDRIASSNKYLILQVQTKSFGSATGFEIPSDLSAQMATTNSGQIAALWRDGTGGFPDVMGRYITFLTALAEQYDGHANLEIVLPVESAQSFGGTAAPTDYSNAKMAEQLDRLYTAMALEFIDTNFASNLNSLGGTGSDNQIPSLLERSYQLGILTGGPDAKQTIAYTAYEGTATGPVAVTRDYRTQMGVIYAVSQDVMGATPGDNDQDPPEVIDAEQAHQTTHLSWIPSLTGDKSWSSIITALLADTAWNNACPDNYAAGCQ